ncbi:UNVERIFIED_CONTAM: Beta-amylase 2, chloroplastic [Sesamum radiatum]|uniref:Beta-amylase n=1 Tax=Sesamum radiatum TaxID=300843 RepID=A0AAW2T209_SESRA
MAFNVPFLDLFRGYSAPSATVSFGRSRATVACRATSGFQQVTRNFPLVQRREVLKSSAPSRTMVRCSGKKFAKDSATLGNQQEVTRNFSLVQRREVLKSSAPSRTMVRCSGKKFAKGSATLGNQPEVLGIIPRVHKQDFTNTPVIHVYVMLPYLTSISPFFWKQLGTFNTDGELADPNNLMNQLKILKSINVDRVMVACWWGIVEGRGPRQYKWGGYKKLFQIVRKLKFKCYDMYLTKSLEDVSKLRGSQFSGRKPEGTGSYNSKSNDTEFFRDEGEFDGFFGQFFLSWYSRVLINHGDQVLAQANRAFAASHGDGTEEDTANGTNIADRIQREFNISKFLALTHRVIDEGDVQALDALAELKTKWEANIGPIPIVPKPPPLQRSEWQSFLPTRGLIALPLHAIRNPNLWTRLSWHRAWAIMIRRWIHKG